MTKLITVFGLISLLSTPAFAAAEHKTHEKHPHKHGKECGHEAVKHDDHTDYKDGDHTHRKHQKHYDECEGQKS